MTIILRHQEQDQNNNSTWLPQIKIIVSILALSFREFWRKHTTCNCSWLPGWLQTPSICLVKNIWRLAPPSEARLPKPPTEIYSYVHICRETACQVTEHLKSIW